MEEWRSLTSEEILQLHAQHCSAENWKQVNVCPDFSAKNISETHFSGDVFIGKLGKELHLSGGVSVESGICRARIHHCRIGDDVYINGVNRYIANYSIGEGSIIENVDCIYTEGESCFGNGTVVSILDETGNRPVMMYEGLSAHSAYIMAMNTFRPPLMEALNKLVLHYARSVESSMGQIGKDCCIRNAGTIRNVKVGDSCEIDGASLLDDGCLCSCPAFFSGEGVEQPMAFAYVGTGVIARHFILAPGSTIKDGTQIERCYVGEAAELTNGFTAHDSLFFANCQMEKGEACASFLGPYSVSVHKSSLMVGGMFSFCNIGSGTNQSNHLYKLGPMHSGICDRGSKTGSGAYILWPGRIGAFTFMKGHHTDNPDTSIFPFSHLFEENGKSWLTPGATLRSIGTLRDESKWPQRDKRTSKVSLDKICFEVLNPVTTYAIRMGLSVMDAFMVENHLQEFSYKGTCIRKSSIVKGRKLYQNALLVQMGNALNKKLERLESEGLAPGELLNALLASSLHPVSESWTDLSGLLVPDSELSVFLAEVENGGVKTVAELEEGWSRFYHHYEKWCWQATLQSLAKQYEKTVQELDLADFIRLEQAWKEATEGFYKQMLADSDLEMSMMRRFHVGENDFSHPFTEALMVSLDEIPARMDHWVQYLRSAETSHGLSI